MILVTDRCCDLHESVLRELGIPTLGLVYHMDGKEYREGPDTDYKDFYNKIRAGAMTSTSQAIAEDFIQFFTPYLEQGQDLLYLAFSSGLSGTYQSALIARDELMAKYPERNIVIVDTLCASLGQGMLVYLAAQKMKSGATIGQIADWANEFKLKINHWVTLDDLQYLKRGGRLSGTQALMGTLLDIRPIIKINDEGKLISVEKKKGRRKAISRLIEKFETDAVDKSIAFICHSDCAGDAEYIAEQLRRINPDIYIYINYIGTVIGAHTGAGTVALFFIGNNR
ncbi:MAG TPA: DegV family protein [Clostridia bacterium]|nr:DegV family protein [Clostridia bacterium]